MNLGATKFSTVLIHPGNHPMKHRPRVFLIILGTLAMLLVVAVAADQKVDPSKIHGRIQLVDSFPDFKVKAVKSFPDAKVKVVDAFPGPGKWQIVDSFPNFQIQLVDSFPDFTVEFADGIPGQAKR